MNWGYFLRRRGIGVPVSQGLEEFSWNRADRMMGVEGRRGERVRRVVSRVRVMGEVTMREILG